MKTAQWVADRIPEKERDRYLEQGADFIDDAVIRNALDVNGEPDQGYVRQILKKSLSISTLDIEECATLLRVKDPDLIAEMEETAGAIKRAVYDNRIVTFAPLYLSSACVNRCRYCNFRADNTDVAARGVLSIERVESECRVLAGKIGHKRLIVVYGEHPDSGVDYMVESIKAIYNVRERTKSGWTQIRRVNVNAAPMNIDELRQLKKVGIGTYQVFQETYNRKLYAQMHPEGTIKSDFRWRLYSMHRAFEAGIDDVGIGALFGLGDWKYDVLGLLAHSIELEKRFGVGPHTISFPRVVPAENAPASLLDQCSVSDEDMRRIVTILRLSVPHTGMILTCRENAAMRKALIPLGVTQTDASSKIGLGAYSAGDICNNDQEARRQQFILNDTRSLDEVVRMLATMGYITSFCTAGYRCGRTGQTIMTMLQNGKEGHLCKLNAVITFREWLDDFASLETREVGEKVLQTELDAIKSSFPEPFVKEFMTTYQKTQAGERDLFY